MHAFDRQTDRRTDRNLIARPRLHSMQLGKQPKENERSKNKPRQSVDARDQFLTNQEVTVFDDVAVIDIFMIRRQK